MIRISTSETTVITDSLITRCMTIGEKILIDFDRIDREIDVYFTDDIEIHRLNKEYRGKDMPTDVLSFRLNDPYDSLEGEIIISRDSAERQRGERSCDDECMVLFIHGMLHILGYDHETDDEYEEMHHEEMKYLPYA